VSHYLDAVREAREERERAGSDFLERLRAAREAGHTLAEIAQAAELTPQGVKWHLDREENR
jgi:hypothetical protein